MKPAVNNGNMQKSLVKGMELQRTFVRVWRVTPLVALLIVFYTAPVLAQSPAGKDLRAFYQQNCASCHGPDGSAVNAEGKKLSGQDFTNEDWLRNTKDEKMVKTILNGKFFGLAMPSFEDTLTSEEAQQMVTEVIRKSKKGEVIAPDAKGPEGK